MATKEEQRSPGHRSLPYIKLLLCLLLSLFQARQREVEVFEEASWAALHPAGMRQVLGASATKAPLYRAQRATGGKAPGFCQCLENELPSTRCTDLTHDRREIAGRGSLLSRRQLNRSFKSSRVVQRGLVVACQRPGSHCISLFF